MKPCGAIILAAGFSERMGVEKLALPYDGLHSFVSRTLYCYHLFGCEPIVLVVNQRGKHFLKKALVGFDGNIDLVVNPFPERGRFFSLKAGLERLNPGIPAFIHNIDNPFVNQALLGQILSLSGITGYVAPVWKGRGGHPVLLSPQVIAEVLKEESESVPLNKILKRFKKTVVAASNSDILLNVNTPDDYQAFLNKAGLDLK